MATESVAAPKLTTEQDFEYVPVAEQHLMSVRPGVDVNFAISHASCLEDSVRTLLEQSVQGGMDSETAYLCTFALGAAKALRNAADQEV
jgi:hypothetical protein